MSLTAIRETLADELGDALDVQAYSYIPERLVPPCVIVSPGSPYVEGDSSANAFGELKVNLRVDIITATKANSVRTDELDSMISTVLETIGNYEVGNVSAPYGLGVNNADYLSVTLDVATFNSF